MDVKPKFVAKYNVWLKLHDELIYVCDKDKNNSFVFRMEILDICETTARRFFCPKYRKNQQAWKKFRHNQKYNLIQDAINKNSRQ